MTKSSNTDFCPQPAPGEQLARSTLALTGITVLSRLLGFARDVIIAYALGGSAAADAFVAVFRIPNFVRRLVGEGAVSLPFIPEYCRRRNQGVAAGNEAKGERQAMLFSRSAMLWVIVIFAPLCALGMIFPEKVLVLAAPGFAARPQEIDAAATLTRLLLPYTLILCTLAVGNGVLQSHNRFLPPVITPCIPNAAILIVMGAAIWIGDVHFYPGDNRENLYAALILCQTLLFSGLLQWIYVGSRLRREKLRWRGPVSLKPAFGFIKKIPLSLCSTATHQANIIIAGMGASFLAEGAIAQLHYADQLISLPLGMFGMAIGIIALPKFTELASQNKLPALQAGVAENINLGLYLSLPAAAGLAGIAEPLVKILFVRGAFDLAAARGTALALQGSALCLPALAVARPLLAVCHVKNYLQLAALAGAASMGCTALFCAGLPKLFPHNPIFGIGLAVSLGAWVFASLLGLCLFRKNILPDAGKMRAILLPFFLAVLIFISSRQICELLFESPYLAVGVTVPLCALAYFGITRAAGCPQANAVFNAFKRSS